MTEVSDYAQLKDFLSWKKANPEEYKDFLIELELFMKDMMNLMKRIY